MYNVLFFAVLVMMFLLALMFVLPPIWVFANNNNPPISRGFYCSVFALLLGLGSYLLYWEFGAATEMRTYYDSEQIQMRNNIKQIRPLYTRLQRELVKNKLDLALDLENVDLILHFATLHSKLQQGVLQPEVVQLLQAVLLAVPQQVSALNLLAINAYKSQQYAQAIEYWNGILQQFTAETRNSAVAKILQDKIKSTRAMQNEFESRQTNKNIF